MKTVLDEFLTSFLHTLAYASSELCIVVAEGFRAAEPHDLNVKSHHSEVYRLDVSADSRLVEVRFTRPIAWQLVDECYSNWDEYDVRDDKSKLQVLSRSRYLDFVRTNHGWFEDVRGLGKHYRIWTENEVMDVVACEPPIINSKVRP
jgi:hypothetical protein